MKLSIEMYRCNRNKIDQFGPLIPITFYMEKTRRFLQLHKIKWNVFNELDVVLKCGAVSDADGYKRRFITLVEDD